MKQIHKRNFNAKTEGREDDIDHLMIKRYITHVLGDDRSENASQGYLGFRILPKGADYLDNAKRNDSRYRVALIVSIVALVIPISAILLTLILRL